MDETGDFPPADPSSSRTIPAHRCGIAQPDGKPYSRMVCGVKTTIDIPDGLYRRAKIRAMETGRTLKDLVLTSLEMELDPVSPAEPEKTTWANRKLRPEFKRLMESGALGGGTDSTVILSEDRT